MSDIKEKQILKAKEKLWREGILKWKLKGAQKEIYDHFKNTGEDVSTVLCSRRFGKTWVMCSIAIEECIKTEKAVVKYVAPTSKMVVNVMYPTVRDIIADCPDDIKPTWYPSEKKWKFAHNGSEIQVAGTDNGSADSIRGGYSQIGIVDEAAFCDDLETVIFNILLPTTDTTGGKVFLASTPNPSNPNHDFHTKFIYPAQAEDRLVKFTLDQSPMVDEETKKRIVSRYPGGESNSKYRCEYLCEIGKEVESAVIPEYLKKKDSIIINDIPKPDFCDFYTSMDLGFRDLTVVLFSYLDYKLKKLVIIDEYVVNGDELTSDKLCNEIRYREKLRYCTNMFDGQDPYIRISDNNNLMLLNELSVKHDMLFQATAKHGKEHVVDTVRQWFDKDKILIHDRCVNLKYHLSMAQWKVTKDGLRTNKFRNIKSSQDGELLKSHADAVDALIYLVRNVQETKNPFPEFYGKVITDDTFISPKYENKTVSNKENLMRKIFNRPKKGRY